MAGIRSGDCVVLLEETPVNKSLSKNLSCFMIILPAIAAVAAIVALAAYLLLLESNDVLWH